MQIDFKEILDNQRFWLQEVHLYEFDPQIKVNSKKYSLVGIQANENLDEPYVSYEVEKEFRKLPLSEVEFVYVEGLHEERLRETLKDLQED